MEKMSCRAVETTKPVVDRDGSIGKEKPNAWGRLTVRVAHRTKLVAEQQVLCALAELARTEDPKLCCRLDMENEFA
jgi:hypothetical protein